jgi:hypothetical protein
MWRESDRNARERREGDKSTKVKKGERGMGWRYKINHSSLNFNGLFTLDLNIFKYDVQI